MALTAAQYLAALIAYMAAGYTRTQAEALMAGAGTLSRPFMDNDDDAATVTLYPAAGTGARNVTRVRGATMSVPYQIRLAGYGTLPYWTSGRWEQKINKPDALSFTYPADAAMAEYLHRPNTLRLLDADGYTVQRFRILQAQPHYRRTSSGITVEVEAESLLGQFGEEWVGLYQPGGGATLAADITAAATTIAVGSGQGAAFPTGAQTLLIGEERISVSARTGDTFTVSARGADGTTAGAHSTGTLVTYGKTIKEHVEDLIETYQEPSRAFACGTIYSDLDDATVFVNFENKTLLQCIEALYAMSGRLGQYTVTASGRFEWRERLGYSGYELRVGRNVRALDRLVDDSNLCTRLYLYGAGLSPSTRVRLSDKSGHTNDYVDQNTATYGIIPRHVISEDIKDADTLHTVAEAMLDILSVPDVSYTASVVDLSVVSNGRTLPIGTRANLVDDEMDVDDDQDITAISRDLGSGAELSVTLGKATGGDTVEDLLTALADRIAAQEERDYVGEINQAMQEATNSGDYEEGTISAPRFTARIFSVSALSVLHDMIDATSGSYVDGLEYVVGDLAVVGTAPGAVLYWYIGPDTINTPPVVTKEWRKATDFMQRVFTAASVAALANLVDSGHADYVPGLAFAAGDQAYLSDGSRAEYNGSSWVSFPRWASYTGA